MPRKTASKAIETSSRRTRSSVKETSSSEKSQEEEATETSSRRSAKASSDDEVPKTQVRGGRKRAAEPGESKSRDKKTRGAQEALQDCKVVVERVSSPEKKRAKKASPVPTTTSERKGRSPRGKSAPVAEESPPKTSSSTTKGSKKRKLSEDDVGEPSKVDSVEQPKKLKGEEEADITSETTEGENKEKETIKLASSSETEKNVATESSEKSSKPTDDTSGFVVVDMKDIPSADSDEVKQCIPKKLDADAAANISKGDAVSTSEECVNGLNGHSTTDPLFNREVITHEAVKQVDPAKKFTVVSYNILAECHRQRNPDYLLYASEEHLNMEYRHSRIMKELEYLNGDVLCLQEVDPKYYNDVLLPDLKSRGYTSAGYIKRVDDYHDEGEATFFRSDRLSLLETRKVVLKESAEKDLLQSELSDEQKGAIRQYLNHPSVLLINKFRCNNTSSQVTIGNIHVVWGKFKIPDVQCIQIANAFREVVSVSGGTENPHILCGDFNSFPASPGYQLATDGYLSDASLEKLQSLAQVDMPDGSKMALVNQLWKGFQHTSSNVKSAYYTCKSEEPKITTWNHFLKQPVDYLWYSASLLDVVSVYECGALGQPAPTIHFPSDHLSLKAEFTFH